MTDGYRFDPTILREYDIRGIHGQTLAAEDADALVIVTEWNEFRALDLQRVKETLKTPHLIDLRNIYNPAELAAAGFRYSSVGRPRPDLEELAEAAPGEEPLQ